MAISLYDRASEAQRHIQSRAKTRTPRVAVILGSGLGGVADAVEDPVEIPYSEIPHFAVSTVEGHDGKLIIGLRVLPRHANARDTAHGGLLMTLLDIALGYNSGFSQNPPAKLTTASLTADFAGAPKVGAWVEAHVDVQKIGGRLAFANAFLVVDGERVVRGSAVFARNAPAADG